MNHLTFEQARQLLAALPRYLDIDVQKRSSATEYLNAEAVDDIINAVVSSYCYEVDENGKVSPPLSGPIRDA